MGIELRIVTSWRRITSSLLYGVKWVIGQVQTGGIDKYLVPYIAVVVTMCTGQGSFLCPISRHCYIIITWKALKHFYHPGLYQKSTFTMYVALVMCIFSNWEEKGKGGERRSKKRIELQCARNVFSLPLFFHTSVWKHLISTRLPTYAILWFPGSLQLVHQSST